MESLFKLRTTPKEVKHAFEWIDECNNECNNEIKPKSFIDTDTCPNCFNVDCLYSTDLVTCKECGYIVASRFDNTAEYRYFSKVDC